MEVRASDLFTQPVLQWTKAVELRWDQPIDEIAAVAIEWFARRGATLSRPQAILAVTMAIQKIRQARRSAS